MRFSLLLKKSMSVIMTLCLAFGFFASLPEVTAESDDEDGIFDVYHPRSGGAYYPRMFTTSKGTLLCAFDTNDDGGRGKIKLTRSTDDGKTWTKEPVTVAAVEGLDCANAAFIEYDGTLLCGYRASALTDGYYTSALMVSKSTDDGYTWSEHSVIDSNTTRASSPSEVGGIYEPYFMELEGKLVVYFASDRIGKSVGSMSCQNIEMMTYDKNTGEWGELRVALDGTAHRSRDGMAVIDKFSDNSGYCMVIEATNVSGHPFVIQLYTSEDGYDWTFKNNIYVPEKRGKKAGAPYVKTLPDGRLAVSFQTDNDAVSNGDGVSYMMTMVSKEALSLDSEISSDSFLAATKPFCVPDGCFSVWNSIEVSGDYFLEFSSVNYPYNAALVRRTKISRLGQSKKFQSSFTLSDCTDIRWWKAGYAGATVAQNQNYSSTTQPSDYMDFYSNGNNGLSMYLSLQPIESRGVDFSNVKYIEFDIWLSNGDMFSRSALRRVSISSEDFNNSQMKSNGRDAFGDFAAQLNDSVLDTPLQSYCWNHIKIPLEGYANTGSNPIDITSVKKLCIQAFESYEASFVACISNVVATVDDSCYTFSTKCEKGLVIPESFGEYTYSADITINRNFEGNSFIYFAMNDYWSTRFLLWDKGGEKEGFFAYTGQLGLTPDSEGREPENADDGLLWSENNNKLHVDIKVNGTHYEMYVNHEKKHSFDGNYVQTLSVGASNCDVTFSNCKLSRGSFKPGDADRNGKIGIDDAMLTLQSAVGKIRFEPALELSCDVDVSGKVTVVDALLILQRSIDKISKFDNE